MNKRKLTLVSGLPSELCAVLYEAVGALMDGARLATRALRTFAFEENALCFGEQTAVDLFGRKTFVNVPGFSFVTYSELRF